MHDAFTAIPVLTFGLIAAIIFTVLIQRHRERLRMHETLRLAFDKGLPIPPEMIAALQMRRPTPQPESDLRVGVTLLCIAAAFIVFGVVLSFIVGDYSEEPARRAYQGARAMWPMIGIAAFPGFIGLGKIAFWLGGRGKSA